MCVWQNDGERAQECYMQSGDAFLLLYSITDRSSFLRASELRITLRRLRPAQHTPIILVGNKCDLVRRRQVSTNGKNPQLQNCNTKLNHTVPVKRSDAGSRVILMRNHV